MRMERERELNEMRRARQLQQDYDQDDDINRNTKSDAAKELEAFRAANQNSGSVRNRYLIFISKINQQIQANMPP